MSFSTEDPWAQYAGDDAATEFGFSHLFYNDSDVIVKLTSVAGVPSLLTEGVDYTIAGVASLPDDPANGVVTYPISGDELATGEKLTIYRMPDFTQLTTFSTTSNWAAAPLEIQLDLLVMLAQYVKLMADRSIRQPLAEGVFESMELAMASVRASKYPHFDAAGGLEYLGSLGGAPLASEVVVDASGFSGVLSPTDTDGQTALDTIDVHVHANSIHKDVAAEISTIAEKTSPVGADKLIIENSAAANAKGMAQIINLPGSRGVIKLELDGQGSVLTTGDTKAWIRMPYAGIITGWTMMADVSGAAVVDVWKTTYTLFDAGATHPVDADSITASAPPTIAASGVKAQDLVIDDWLVNPQTFSVDDVIGFNLDSVAAFTKLTLELHTSKTGV